MIKQAPFAIGDFVEEIGPKYGNKQRNGIISKIKTAFIFITDDNGVEWRKTAKYLRKTTREAIKIDVPIGVDSMIECVGGVHLGEWGRVVQVTNKSYRFKCAVSEREKLARKHNARALVVEPLVEAGPMSDKKHKRPRTLNEIVSILNFAHET